MIPRAVEYRTPLGGVPLEAATLEQLDADELEVLQCAAHVGIEFEAAVVAAAVARPLMRVLRALTRVGKRHGVVRNVAAGSLSKRLGLEEGMTLPRTIVEYCLKAPELEDPMITEEHIGAFGWASPQEIDEMLSMSLRVNDFLSGLFHGIGIRLIDFRLEFGRLWVDDQLRIVLADEISPDNCRLWDLKTNEKMDKDRFRRDLGEVPEAYQEVARRLGILPESGPADQKGSDTIQ